MEIGTFVAIGETTVETGCGENGRKVCARNGIKLSCAIALDCDYDRWRHAKQLCKSDQDKSSRALKMMAGQTRMIRLSPPFSAFCPRLTQNE